MSTNRLCFRAKNKLYYIKVGCTGAYWVLLTIVWPNSFLLNVFFALKGSKKIIIIIEEEEEVY